MAARVVEETARAVAAASAAAATVARRMTRLLCVPIRAARHPERPTSCDVRGGKRAEDRATRGRTAAREARCPVSRIARTKPNVTPDRNVRRGAAYGPVFWLGTPAAAFPFR